MQQRAYITADAPASHVTLADVAKLAQERHAQLFHLGQYIQIRRGSFVRDFTINDDGLLRAAPIRSWLGV